MYTFDEGPISRILKISKNAIMKRANLPTSKNMREIFELIFPKEDTVVEKQTRKKSMKLILEECKVKPQ